MSQTTAETGDRVSDRPLIIVGIGASAGGLEAVISFLTHLPPDNGMAFVLVQHLDPSQPSLMAELLSRQTKMAVQTAADGVRVEPNHFYVIPPNVRLTMKGGVLQTSTPAGHSMVRTHIDTFFRSLAADQAGHAVGVILSGAGSDGTMGLKAIKEQGGLTIAQDPASAKFDSMPQSAIASGMVDFTLPVEEIPAKLLVHAKYLEERAEKINPDVVAHEMAGHLPRICQILLQATGHDFSGYKSGTMMRRIERRMQVRHVDSIVAYMAELEQDSRESEQLFKDLLIGVTQFFRNPDAFEALAMEAIPRILEGKSGDAGVRIWVPGCASGEEAYSIAMLMSESMERLNVAPLVQIFATDIDEGAITAARLGQYPASLVEQLGPERRERFFIRRGDSYQVIKQIRDMCVFSIHNLVRDPPFSSLDLISCRNLLIYMDSTLQKRVVPLFHYALAPRGYLLLGSSEGLGSAAELFRELDAKHRLFQRADGVAPAAVVFPLAVPGHPTGRFAEPAARAEQAVPRDLGGIVGRMVQRYAPPCVVINERAEIVYSSGETSPWLQQPTGAPTLNLIDQARKGLRSSLRTAIRQAIKTRQPATHENLTVTTPDGLRAIDLIVRPVPELDAGSRLLAVIFQPARGKALKGVSRPAGEESTVGQLEMELHATHGELESTIEALKRATEDATSSNEELLSMNEEMQSANEELQSSKEEMQSVNEELSTVNSELNKKVEQLDGANADLQNLIRITEIATLFLDRELRIKRFTPAATLIFRLLDSDIGRPISDFAPRFAEGDLIAEMKEVLQTLAVRQRQVYLPATRSWLLVRLLPSRTVANTIDGVVATFVDITVLKEAEDSLRQSEELARQLANTIPAIAWTARADGTMDFYNERISQYQGFEKREDGTWEWRAALHPDDAQRTLQAWQRSVDVGEPYQVEHRLRIADGQWRWHISRAAPVRDEHSRIVKWSGTAVDIDDLRSAQAARVKAETAKEVSERAGQAKDEFLAVLSHELRTPLAPVVLALGMLQNDPRFDVDTRASLEMIRRNVDIEARLIDDLLDVARIARGKIELDRRPVDLDTILRRAVEVCMPDIQTRNIKFAINCPGGPFVVDADEVRLQQVFWNLLRNAVKFTPPGGSVGIRCRRDGDDLITVEVNDSGEGIEPDLLPRLFQAFEQGGKQITRRFGGLGLGLSISKTLVTLHGGTVTVRSEGKGRGTTFAVQLPLLPADAIPDPASAPSAAVLSSPSVPRRKLRILLVEDHGDTARMMRRLLSHDGFEVQTAADVATSLRLMEEDKAEVFDLLISDLGLPDASGLDLMRTIRARGLKLPGIALSGYGQEQDIQQTREAGFAEHLLKPVNITKLHEAIARAVGEGAQAAEGETVPAR